jgi:POT family proton-dependent oligopeptide transporter
VIAINYAMAGEMIQPEHQGLFTGYLFLNIAFGINLAGPISNFAINGEVATHMITAASTNPMYMKIFLIMAAVAVVITFIFFLLMKMLNRMLDAQKINVVPESELE